MQFACGWADYFWANYFSCALRRWEALCAHGLAIRLPRLFFLQPCDWRFAPQANSRRRRIAMARRKALPSGAKRTSHRPYAPALGRKAPVTGLQTKQSREANSQAMGAKRFPAAQSASHSGPKPQPWGAKRQLQGCCLFLFKALSKSAAKIILHPPIHQQALMAANQIDNKRDKVP